MFPSTTNGALGFNNCAKYITLLTPYPRTLKFAKLRIATEASKLRKV